MIDPNDRFDQLLKAMVQGEPPKPPHKKRDREETAHTAHDEPRGGASGD